MPFLSSHTPWQESNFKLFAMAARAFPALCLCKLGDFYPGCSAPLPKHLMDVGAGRGNSFRKRLRTLLTCILGVSHERTQKICRRSPEIEVSQDFHFEVTFPKRLGRVRGTKLLGLLRHRQSKLPTPFWSVFWAFRTETLEMYFVVLEQNWAKLKRQYWWWICLVEFSVQVAQFPREGFDSLVTQHQQKVCPSPSTPLANMWLTLPFDRCTKHSHWSLMVWNMAPDDRTQNTRLEKRCTTFAHLLLEVQQKHPVRVFGFGVNRPWNCVCESSSERSAHLRAATPQAVLVWCESAQFRPKPSKNKKN